MFKNLMKSITPSTDVEVEDYYSLDMLTTAYTNSREQVILKTSVYNPVLSLGDNIHTSTVCMLQCIDSSYQGVSLSCETTTPFLNWVTISEEVDLSYIKHWLDTASKYIEYYQNHEADKYTEMVKRHLSSVSGVLTILYGTSCQTE